MFLIKRNRCVWFVSHDYIVYDISILTLDSLRYNLHCIFIPECRCHCYTVYTHSVYITDYTQLFCPHFCSHFLASHFWRANKRRHSIITKWYQKIWYHLCSNFLYTRLDNFKGCYLIIFLTALRHRSFAGHLLRHLDNDSSAQVFFPIYFFRYL